MEEIEEVDQTPQSEVLVNFPMQLVRFNLLVVVITYWKESKRRMQMRKGRSVTYV